MAAGPAVRAAVQQARSEGRRINPWRVLGNSMPEMTPYDNSDRLLFDMETYGVDIGVLIPAFGMTDELNVELVERHPGRFVAEYGGMAFVKECRAGTREWSIGASVADIRAALSTGCFVGLGEQPSYMPVVPLGEDPRGYILSEDEAASNMFRIAEVAREFGVICRTHSGCTMGYETGGHHLGSLGPYNFNVMLVHELAAFFPDVTFVINHGGIQGSRSKYFFDQAIHVAAAHDNVYLETGLWWRELYDEAFAEPNLGAEKLVWGTDWGASIPCVTHLGQSHFEQIRKDGPISHQSDYWGWSLNELLSVRCSQDDRNLILGGNAARIYGLPVRHSRLFRQTSVDGVARPAIDAVKQAIATKDSGPASDQP